MSDPGSIHLLFGDGAEGALLRAVLDHTEDGIVACDASGVLRYFNRATRTMHGLPEEPLPPERWAEHYGLFAADGVTPLRSEQIPLLRALRDGEVKDAAMVIVPRRGEPRRVVASGRAVFNSNGDKVGAVVSMHEVTDRKALQREREQLQLAQVAAILSSVAEGVVAADASGNVAEWNEAALAMHDFEDLEQARKHLSAFAETFELRTPEGHVIPLDQWPMSRALRGETFSRMEVCLRRFDRDWQRYIEYSGTSVRRQSGELAAAILTLHDVTVRRQAEELLAEQRRQMEMVVEGANVGVWYCPLPFDRLIWDATVKAHFHLPPDAEVTVDTFYERLHVEDRERTRYAIEESIVKRESYNVEYRTISPDGLRTKWIHASGRGFYDAGGKPLRFDGITIDITDKKRAETELRENEARLRLALAIAQIGTFDIDLLTDGVVVNDTGREIYGWGVNEPLTFSKVQTHFHRDDRGSVMRQVEAALDPRGPGEFEVEQRIVRVDRATRWIRVRGRAVFEGSRDKRRAVRILGTYLDVTDAKTAERALRDSEERFRQLANSMPQLAWMAAPDGWVFWYNERWYEYTGTTPEQMEGWGWQSVHDASVLPHVVERWKASIATGERFEMTFPLRGADGTYRPFLTRVAPLRDAAGKIALWFGTNTDVGDQARMLAERETLLASEQAARERAEEESRLKDEFLATLSHELRTPLNAILGWTHLIGSGRAASGQDLRKGMEVIERNARAQAQLIEDLLDMSRIISGKIRLDARHVDLADVVESACQTVRPAAEAKGLNLREVCDPLAGPVLGDPNRLQQIIWNLLHNAVKFTPPGGSVEVAVQRASSHLELSVRDSGDGIRPDFLPHVFDRFRQADGSTTRRHGGLGLGLSIVKQLVELHGGSVRAQSAGEGHGATFIVSLPLATHREELELATRWPAFASVPSSGEAGRDRLAEVGGSASALAPDVPRLNGARVLVVDDDADARELVRRLLEEHGAEVEVASAALQALDRLCRTPFHVLVSDIGMPDVDGYELIRRLRQLTAPCAGVPAVALTAFARSDDRRRAIAAGYQMHLAKPLDPSELVTIVASLAGVLSPPRS